jgi:hypothetical protein
MAFKRRFASITPVISRLKPLIAALAIALQAIDGIVGALGHSHVEDHGQSEDLRAAHVHSGCSHHCAHSLPNADDRPISDSSVPGRDDCSLCRHFSQPVAPATTEIDLVGCERVEVAEVLVVERVLSLAPASVTARGPPALLA